MASCLLAAGAGQTWSQSLDTNCIVSILNRSAKVDVNGGYRIFNVPAGTGEARVRATCVDDGTVRYGESPIHTVMANEGTGIGPISFLASPRVPTNIAASLSQSTLTSVGATSQITVIATLPDATTIDATPGDSGTTYLSTNPAVATVDRDGRVTAVSSGRVLLTASHESILKTLFVTVNLAGTDQDGDGLPDDFEIANGLNPNDGLDALADPDQDGLSNLQEFQAGTALNLADTDVDGILDGEELSAGSDGFITNPLLADTDGDGLRDALEVSTASDPTDAASYNLSAALTSISVSPSFFTLVINTVFAQEVGRQLAVTGSLRDGTSLDLTPASRGTQYASSNLQVAQFTSTPGHVIAIINNPGQAAASLSVTVGGFTAQAQVDVITVAPSAVSFLPLPGFSNSLDLAGSFAYVAGGGAGLHVVDISEPGNSALVGTFDTPGNANDVRVSGGYAYVADGLAGLRVVNVASPAQPVSAGSLALAGEAWDIFVTGDLAYMAMGASGLAIVDVSDAAAPILRGTLALPGTARGVAVSGATAVVSGGSGGVHVVDISDPSMPLLRGSVHTRGTASSATNVAIRGSRAYITDGFTSDFVQGGIKVVDFSVPTAPSLIGQTSGQLGLNDIVLDSTLALGADFTSANGVAIFDVGPASPISRGSLDFLGPPLFRDDNGTGIKAAKGLVYMTGNHELGDNGVSGNGGLWIGRHMILGDEGTIAPTVQLTAPTDGSTVYGGAQLLLTATAEDDSYVTKVEFLVDGQVVATDRTSPYSHMYTVPFGISELRIQARAHDLAGNLAVSGESVLSVQPAPGSTVVGRVIDNNGNAVASATVSVPSGITGVTASDGRFSLPDVPGIGSIIVTASLGAGSGRRQGVSQATPAVAGGVTDVGDIRIFQGRFETDIGTPLVLGSDGGARVDFAGGFSFPFFGSSYSHVFINYAGNLTFDAGDPNPSGTVAGFRSTKRISPMWFPFPVGAGGTIHARQEADRILITWSNVVGIYPDDATGQVPGNTFQVALHSDGSIHFRYRDVGLLNRSYGYVYGIVGVSPGDGSAGTARDFTAQTPFSILTPRPIYEVDAYDHVYGNLLFTPNSGGGFEVDFLEDDRPPTAGILSPLAGTSLLGGGIADLAIDFADDVAVEQVELFVDGAFVATWYIHQYFPPPIPYQLTVPADATSLQVEVRVTDWRQQVTAKVLTYPVIEDQAPPSVTLTAPMGGSQAVEGSTLQLAAQATDNAGIARVEFLVNGAIVASDEFAPYTHAYPVPVGATSLSLQARAIDFSGNTGTSPAAEVTVTENLPPQVQLTAPAPGVQVIEGSRITLSATATDDISVARVEFLVDGALIGSDLTAPYSISHWRPMGTGSRLVEARAVDGTGHSGLSQPITIQVIPDPGTTVVGRTVDSTGNPLAGAVVAIFKAFTAMTASDGTFSIPGVPTIRGNTAVKASHVATLQQAGNPGAIPVPDGVTSLGDIVLNPVPISGLVAYWPLHGDAQDAGGNGYHGTVFNALPDGDRHGADTAMHFDGTVGSYVVSGPLAGLNTAMTLSAWIRVDAFNDNWPFISHILGEDRNSDRGLLRLGDAGLESNRLQFALGSARYNSATELVEDTWYHVAATTDGITARIYIDGQLDLSGAAVPFRMLAPFFIGNGLAGGGGARGFNGTIDDARVYNRALDAGEILRLYREAGAPLP